MIRLYLELEQRPCKHLGGKREGRYGESDLGSRISFIFTEIKGSITPQNTGIRAHLWLAVYISMWVVRGALGLF